MGYTPYLALPTTHYCNLLTNIISLLPRELTKIMIKLAPSKQEPHNSTQKKKKKALGNFFPKHLNIPHITDAQSCGTSHYLDLLLQKDSPPFLASDVDPLD
jgi:hypothetical protein